MLDVLETSLLHESGLNVLVSLFSETPSPSRSSGFMAAFEGNIDTYVRNGLRRQCLQVSRSAANVTRFWGI